VHLLPGFKLNTSATVLTKQEYFAEAKVLPGFDRAICTLKPQRQPQHTFGSDM